MEKLTKSFDAPPTSPARKSDFLGESLLINGEWVRQVWSLTPQERNVYRSFGRFFMKMRALHSTEEKPRE